MSEYYNKGDSLLTDKDVREIDKEIGEAMSNETIEAANKFIASDEELRLACLEIPISIDWMADKLADFSDQQNAELKAEVEKLREKLQTIFGRAMAFQPDTPGENVILYRWVGEIKALARIEEKK
jgi:uncharacterized coiled-coil protein SlyX